MAKEKERAFIIDGFAFHSRKEAERAQKELEGIRYLKTKMEGQEPEKLLQLYHKVLEEGLFETPVGMHFVRELEEELRNVPYLTPEQIRPIDIPKGTGLRLESSGETVSGSADKKQKSEQNQNQKSRYTGGLKLSLLINVLLVLVIIAMFAISLTSDNVTIINYENKIIDKYEAWEQELEQREQAVEEYEDKYGIN